LKKLTFTLITLVFLVNLVAEKTFSTKKAFLFSAVVPGAGEFYTRSYVKGSVSLITEIALISSLVYFNNEQDRAVNSYKKYASTKLGINQDMEDDYYKTIASFVSNRQYDENVRLNAQNYYGYGTIGYNDFVTANSISEELAWDWESTAQLQKYKDIRSRKQDYRQYASIASGIMIVHHIYSAVSTAISSKSHNKKFTDKHTFDVYPDYTNQGVNFSYGYNF